MNKLIFFLSLATLFSFTFSKGETRKIYADNSASSIMYFMSHPLHDWDASAKTFKTVITFDDATKEIKSVATMVKVQSFDSGNSNRDSHAIEVLEALKYPNITFTSSNIEQNGEELTINGKLNFHNVTKPVSFKAIRKNASSSLVITGRMEINMKDYEVKPPSLMGMDTKEDIRLDFTMTFKL